MDQSNSTKKLGTKVGLLFAAIFILSITTLVIASVLTFRGVIMDLLKTECVNGTNLLSYELSRTKGDKLDQTQLLDDLKAQTGCEFTIFEGDERAYTTVTQNNERVVGTKLSADVAKIVLTEGKTYVGEAEIQGVPHLCSYVPTRSADGEVTGLIFSGISSHDATAKMNQSIFMMCGIGVLFLVGGILLLSYLIRRIVSIPLMKLTAFAHTIEQGDLGLSSKQAFTSGIQSADEIGALAHAFELTVKRLKDYIAEISLVLAAIADNDLTVRPSLDYIGDFKSIQHSLHDITRKLNQTVHQILSSSNQVLTGSEQVSNGAQVLSQGAVEQAGSLQELAVVVNEISQRIQENAIHAQEASERAGTLELEMTSSSEQMQKMTEAMSDINSSSDKIGKIIKTIEDIAFQTNILALNAAVEAARAGQAGKGFSVVADEVRNLAAKSAQASKDTAALIKESIQSARNGKLMADSTAESLTAAASGAKNVVSLVTQMSADTAEQANAITQVTQGIDEISNVVQSTSAASEESAAASETLSAQAQALENLVQQFKLTTNTGRSLQVP